MATQVKDRQKDDLNGTRILTMKILFVLWKSNEKLVKRKRGPNFEWDTYTAGANCQLTFGKIWKKLIALK